MFVLLLIASLLLTSYHAEAKKKSRSIYFLAVNYNNNNKFLKNFEISITNKTSINILLDVQEILSDVWSNANIYIWVKKFQAYRSFISYDVDLCGFLNRSKLNKANMVNAWLANFLKNGNLSRNCPIIKNLYYIANLKPDKDSIPSFSPAGRCRLQTNIYTKQNGLKEAVASAEFEIEVK